MLAHASGHRPRPTLDAHETGHEGSDVLAAAALGTLAREEPAVLAARLAKSPQDRAARADLADMRQVVSSLALLADEASPSSGLRERIRQAVAPDQQDAGSLGNETPPT